jgi:hypothetical protein
MCPFIFTEWIVDEKAGLKPLYEQSELWRRRRGRVENCVAILTRDRFPYPKNV